MFFFTTYFDFSELISLNNEKLLRFNLTFVQFSKINLFTYTNLKNRIIFCRIIIDIWSKMVRNYRIPSFFNIFFILFFYHQGNLKFVTLKRHTPGKFDQFLEDDVLTGRAISMTLNMKITVTIVLVLRYLPFFHII